MKELKLQISFENKKDTLEELKILSSICTTKTPQYSCFHIRTTDKNPIVAFCSANEDTEIYTYFEYDEIRSLDDKYSDEYSIFYKCPAKELVQIIKNCKQDVTLTLFRSRVIIEEGTKEWCFDNLSSVSFKSQVWTLMDQIPICEYIVPENSLLNAIKRIAFCMERFGRYAGILFESTKNHRLNLVATNRYILGKTSMEFKTFTETTLKACTLSRTSVNAMARLCEDIGTVCLAFYENWLMLETESNSNICTRTRDTYGRLWKFFSGHGISRHSKYPSTKKCLRRSFANYA